MFLRRLSFPLLTKMAQHVRWWRSWRTLPVPAWVRGAALYRQGRFREAIEAYQLGLAEHLDHPAAFSARLDLSYCFSRNGRFGDAISELRGIIELRPELREAYIRLSRLHAWLGNPLEALAVLKKAWQRFAPDAELAALILHYAVEGEAAESVLAEAFACVEQQEEQRGSNSFLRTALASFLLHRGQGDKALEILNVVCKGPDASCEALLCRAKLLSATGQCEGAVEDILRLLKIRPGYPQALSLLARMYLDESALNEPEFALRSAVTACQNTAWSSPRELMTLAEVYLRAEDQDLALMMAQKAREASLNNQGLTKDLRRVNDFIDSLTTNSVREAS